MNFIQALLPVMMPYLYGSLFLFGILGFRFGALHDYNSSVITAIAVLFLRQFIPFLPLELPDLLLSLLSGFLSAVVIGIVAGCISRQLFLIFIRFV